MSALALSGHAAHSDECPLLRDERTSRKGSGFVRFPRLVQHFNLRTPTSPTVVVEAGNGSSSVFGP
jgi:hypothetical protein